MDTNTVEFKAEHGVNYGGRLGKKPYVARITGTDTTYGFAREFIVVSDETRDHWNRARHIVTYSYIITEEGLYEKRTGRVYSYRVVFLGRSKDDLPDAPKHLVWIEIDRARAMAIAERMTSGETFDAARIATKPIENKTTQ